jgi:hypothetical protein
MQVKRDTAANWTANNPVLLSGQLGWESDTNKIKIGNGSTSWTGLSYFSGSGSSSNYYSLIGGATNTNPSDSTIYYIGGHPATTMLTSASNCVALSIPVSGTITAASVYAVGSAGTNEAVTLEIRVNDTTSYNITSSGDFSTIGAVGAIYSNTSMSAAVSVNDWIHLRIITPAWVTNPVGVRVWFSIIISI